MKVEVQIDSHFQEEAVMITAPALSARVEKIRDFVEELDQKGRLRAKKDWEAYLIESQLFQRLYIENRQVIGETMTDQFILTGHSISYLKTCRPAFSKFPNLKLSTPKKSITCTLPVGDPCKSILKTGV